MTSLFEHLPTAHPLHPGEEAALPLVVGLSGEDYEVPSAFSDGYRSAMLICAGLLVVGAALAALTVSNTVQLAEAEAPEPVTEPACARVPAAGGHYCGVDAPPLESVSSGGDWSERAKPGP